MATPITFASIRGVRAEESNLYRNRQTGFQFEVVGDGKLEPQVQDAVGQAFPNSQVTDDIASLKTFVARHARLAADCIPKPDAKMLEGEAFEARQQEIFGKLDAAAENCLGDGWHVVPSDTSINRFGGVNYASYARENGPVEQEVRFTHNDRDGSIETVFSTRVPGQNKESLDVRQDIQFLADSKTGVFRADTVQESAQFNFA